MSKVHTGITKLSSSQKCRKNFCFQNINGSSFCRDKVIVLNLDNASKRCTADNLYVKSSYRDKIIIFKPKMKKNVCAIKILTITMFLQG